MSKCESYTIRPIGIIHSPYVDISDVPQKASSEIRAVVEIYPEYTEGISDIKKGDDIIILFYFHEAMSGQMRVMSRSHKKLMGVFSTRSPGRPNHIGMSIVKVENVRFGEIEFSGVDMIDSTPVIDIKPN